MPAPTYIISKVADPIFAVVIGLAAAGLRINREEEAKGYSTSQTIQTGLRLGSHEARPILLAHRLADNLAAQLRGRIDAHGEVLCYFIAVAATQREVVRRGLLEVMRRPRALATAGVDVERAVVVRGQHLARLQVDGAALRQRARQRARRRRGHGRREPLGREQRDRGVEVLECERGRRALLGAVGRGQQRHRGGTAAGGCGDAEQHQVAVEAARGLRAVVAGAGVLRVRGYEGAELCDGGAVAGDGALVAVGGLRLRELRLERLQGLDDGALAG
ncbi:hypothetical protein CRV24_004813 [Beauveria bassiana]|nr:hypothetical protein CRV24_004813 [Beauveria bassiana]